MKPETKGLCPANWSEISGAVILESYHRCTDCGWYGGLSNMLLTVHHIDYDPANNARDNLVCLCWPCRRKRRDLDLAEATRLRDMVILIRMGQLCFRGMEPRYPKRLDLVVSGKALSRISAKWRRVQPGIEQSPGPAAPAGKGSRSEHEDGAHTC